MTPKYTPQVSLGNLIQIAVIVLGIGGSWAAMELRSRMNEDRLAEIKMMSADLGLRVRLLESAKARDDERFASILQFMSKIDGRLDRLDRKGD